MPVAAALAWIDALVATLGSEDVLLDEGAGRVLAEAVVASSDLPATDRAAIDGVAVRADQTAGASAYNPLPFPSVAPGAALPAGGGALVGIGDKLPGGADAVVPLEHVEQRPAGFDVIEGIAAGSGVERRASHWARGDTLLAAGRRLLPWELGLLAAAGIARVRVVRRPRIRCLMVARRDRGSGAALEAPPCDTNGPLLRALIGRDGGFVTEQIPVDRTRASIREALKASSADLIISVGGTGSGADDDAAAALGEAGDIAAHGIALSPGETAGLGRLASGVPVFLLPGMPVACLWAYEFFAGRALRRLAGRNPDLPFQTRRLTTAAKIVSTIGTTEICPVRRLDEQQVVPIASFVAAGLGAALRADGFVIVAAGSEGYPKGASVIVHLRDDSDLSPIHQARGSVS